ncbi:MAG: tRNA (adenosine(37)-N6)-threonylcarbamoyltransferase complex dimerization subunit type 1 TsaB [Anaeroplasmataceae bacterium]
MNYLIVDTATPILYVGLKTNDKYYSVSISEANGHGKNLVPCIKKALNDANLKLDDLDFLICGEGPGSYTGVRMGVTVLKMFSTLLNIKLYKISSLFLMSSGIKEDSISFIDARRGNGFIGIIDKDKNVIEEVFASLDEYINKYPTFKLIDSYNSVINLDVILNKMVQVTDVDKFVPNYLRESEATRNLNNG